MSRPRIDDITADALLAGSVDGVAVGPELAHVADLVRVARGPAIGAELGSAAEVARIASAVRTACPAPIAVPRSKSRLAKALTLKVVAIGGVALCGVTAAAASTGSLPAPAQTRVANVLRKAGLSVPDPAMDAGKKGESEHGKSARPTTAPAAPHPTSTPHSTSTSTSTSATGEHTVSDRGRLADPGHGDSVKHDEVANTSTSVRPTDTTGTSTTATPSGHGHKDDHTKSGPHGDNTNTTATPATSTSTADTQSRQSDKEKSSHR